MLLEEKRISLVIPLLLMSLEGGNKGVETAIQKAQTYFAFNFKKRKLENKPLPKI